MLDEATVSALETDLHKIKSSLDRNQLYNILYDMTISGKIPGARVIEIVKNNIKFLEQEDVIVEIFRSILPTITKKFVPSSIALQIFDELFNLTFGLLK